MSDTTSTTDMKARAAVTAPEPGNSVGGSGVG